MGKKTICTCDRCGKVMDWQAECDNGMSETMRFRVQNKIAEHIPGCSYWQRCYKTVVMCPACWKEFEKVYREFMGK
jgi:hypothetical protein